MRPASNKVRPALAALGVCSALGVAAVPMLHVWLTPEQSDPMPAQNAANVDSDRIVVDLRDNVTSADIRQIAQATGLDLQFVSPFSASSDKLMEATLAPGQDAGQVLGLLRRDSRVESAEPEIRYSLPENPFTDPEGAWEASKQLAREDAARYNAFCNVPADSWSVSAPTSDASSQLLCTMGDPVNGTSLITCNASVASANGILGDDSAFKPNDPRYNEQWNFQMVGAEDAWKRSRGKGIVVAVIDTGVAGGNTKRGKPCKDFNTTSFVPGYDFINKDADPYDDHGHGTHVAGTIAESTDNNEGVAGLAFESSIMPLKVLSAQGWGTSADIADAIRWAADHGANVINMSLGSSQPSTVIHNACKYAYKKGVTIVCAAGNGFGEGVSYPAAYPECIAVSSVGPTGNLAFYSSYGKQVALAAPGGDMSKGPQDGILQNTNFPDDPEGKGDDYYHFQGTSMASPHVAAVAALIEAQGVTDPARVKEVLTASASPKKEKIKYGAGILSAAKATEKASEQTGPNALQFVIAAVAGLFFLAGSRRFRSIPLRAAMAGSLLLGFFGPDWFAAHVGADSAWNMLSFSALLPLGLYLATRRGGALIKIAGAAALGVGLAMLHDLYVDSAPFTTATFGDSALPWIYTNLGIAVAIAGSVTARALRAVRRFR